MSHVQYKDTCHLSLLLVLGLVHSTCNGVVWSFGLQSNLQLNFIQKKYGKMRSCYLSRVIVRFKKLIPQLFTEKIQAMTDAFNSG